MSKLTTEEHRQLAQFFIDMNKQRPLNELFTDKSVEIHFDPTLSDICRRAGIMVDISPGRSHLSVNNLRAFLNRSVMLFPE